MKANKAIIVILLFGGIIAGILFLPVRQWFMHFESYVQSLGAIAPVLVVLAYILSPE